MPQWPWLSGCPAVPHVHEEIQLSSRRDLWDLRQVPCPGPLCPCCSEVHKSMEMVQTPSGQLWSAGFSEDGPVHPRQRQSPWQVWAGELREEMCLPFNSRGNAHFTAGMKLRCLRRNLALLEAQGSVTEAKPSRWPRLETEPKANPSQWRGVCTQLLFFSGEQQCDTYTDLHHAKDSKQTLWEY